MVLGRLGNGGDGPGEGEAAFAKRWEGHETGGSGGGVVGMGGMMVPELVVEKYWLPLLSCCSGGRTERTMGKMPDD